MSWRLIDGPESADAVAEEILKAPLRRCLTHIDLGRDQFRNAAVRG